MSYLLVVNTKKKILNLISHFYPTNNLECLLEKTALLWNISWHPNPIFMTFIKTII